MACAETFVRATRDTVYTLERPAATYFWYVSMSLCALPRWTRHVR